MNILKITFPDSFKKEKGVLGKDWWRLFNKENTPIVSILAEFTEEGNYEMWDFREEYPQRYLSIEEINQHFIDNPITDETLIPNSPKDI